MSEQKILLRNLIDCCHRLSIEACATIRDVEAEREMVGAEALDASLKDATDSRTYLTKADTKAQEIIWKGLRQKYGVQLTIVGEEDPKDYEVEGADISCDSSSAAIELDALKNYHIPAELQELLLSDVVVFIDPVDGTREFVEGRIDSCQCLIGISYRGRSIAGVVGLPFARVDGEENSVNCNNTEIKILFGVVGSNDAIHGIESIHQPNLAPHSELVLAISADLGEKHPTLKFVRETILATAKTPETRLLKLGGCGNKFLRVMTGEADVAMMNLSCSFWDTCATEALVVAAGGTVSTYTGWTLDHVTMDDDDKESYKNKYGVLVTGKSAEKKLGVSHSEFVKRFISNNKLVRDLLKPMGIVTADDEEVYVVDMLRSIQDGSVITAQDLSKMIRGPQISSYHALEKDAVRYKQSHACRLRFDNGSTAFLKRIVLRELPGAITKAQTMPHKLLRDIKANVNESNFLKSGLVKKFNDTARDGGLVKIVHAYDCQARVYQDIPLDSRFLLLLEDFSEVLGWHQYAHLDEAKMKATLRCLAKFHAFFWLKDGNNRENDDLRGALWPVATYWDVEKQTADQIGMLEGIFQRLLEEFGILDEETETRRNEMINKNYGKKLATLATDLDTQIHNATKKQTLIHGDAKSANFFYRESGADVDVGVIDFQWSGAGLCAVDVAYAIWACPELGVLEKEEHLVDFYHKELVDALRSRFPDHGDVDAWLPLEQLKLEYRMAFLDFCRCVVGDHWRTIKVDTIRGRQALPSQNKKVFNAYNKDVDIAKRMLRKMMEALNQY